jgi:hypothetical protein
MSAMDDPIPLVRHSRPAAPSMMDKVSLVATAMCELQAAGMRARSISIFEADDEPEIMVEHPPEEALAGRQLSIRATGRSSGRRHEQRTQ